MKNNYNCTASFVVKVKRDTKHTRSYDSYVQEGLFGFLRMKFKHSHSLYDSKEWTDAQTWSYLRKSKKIRRTFNSYFSSGELI